MVQWMARRLRFILALLLVTWLFGWVAPGVAHADPRTEFLVKQLKTSDDFRVRTQAALALGASGDGEALQPLCSGLADSNVSVRSAAAAALGKLGKKEGVACLKSARAKEKDSSVNQTIDQSLGKLAGGADPPPPGPNTKFYVAIQVTNRTSRPNGEIEAVVRAAMQSKLVSNKEFAVAPKAETVAQAGPLVKGKRLKGLMIMASVEPIEYKGGNLSVVLKVTYWTYPEKSLKATGSPATATQEGMSSPNAKVENELIVALSENAVQGFVKVAGSL
jgi:hypothetical protein